MFGILAALGTALVQGAIAKKGQDKAISATQAGEAARLDYLQQAMDAYKAQSDKILAVGKEASQRAIEIQKSAGEEGRDLIMDMLQLGLNEYAPYKEAGLEALDTLRKDVSVPLGESPFYKWQQQQGQKAIDMAFAARGGFGSGAAVQAQSAFQQELGGKEVAVRREQLNKLAQYGYGAAEATAGLEQRAGEAGAAIASDTARGIAGTLSQEAINEQNVFGKLGEYQATLLGNMGAVKQQSAESQGQIRANTYNAYLSAIGGIPSSVLNYQDLYSKDQTKKKSSLIPASPIG